MMWGNKRKERDMKNNVLSIFWIGAMMSLCLSFAACEQEESVCLPDNAASGLTFVAQLPGTMTVDTKASTPSLGTDDKIEVKDVWILQYGKLDAGGSEGWLAFVHFTGEAINQAQNSSGGTYDNIVTVTSQNNDFRYVKSRFYVIVNGGANLFEGKTTTTGDKTSLNITEANLKALTVSLTMGASSVPTIQQSGLLTAGPIAYAPTGSGEGQNEKVVFIGSLTRAYAKVSLTVNLSKGNNGSFSVSEATVENVPTYMALYAKAGEKGNFPAGTAIYSTAISIGAVTVGTQGVTPSTPNAKSFYLAENYRGKGTATSVKEKNIPAKGPDGKLDNCTCLRLKGTYKYDSSHTNGIEVEYCFYLGDDMLSDYNIQRNYHYALTVNIAGPNSADYRVKITNGNVAVFDDVDIVNNEVTF